VEIAKVITARAVRLFDIEELNPQGRNLLPIVFPIRDRYRFVRGPLKAEDVDITKGLKFWDGSFRVGDKDVSVNLEIYGDGVVASTQSSTSDSDALIDDLLIWIAEKFGIRNEVYILKPKKTYRSELVVFAPEVDLHRICGELNTLCSEVPGANDETIELLGFSLGASSPQNQPRFAFERRANTPFDQHKYYTSAQMPTEQHLAVLETLAKLLGVRETKSDSLTK
jgi:hypothetical protein